MNRGRHGRWTRTIKCEAPSPSPAEVDPILRPDPAL
jgi:hypothetical protein